MTDEQVLDRRQTRLRTWMGTLAIFAVYATVMLSTNTHFTILDDEADSIAIAGRPLIPALRPFFTGVGFHELHPPAAEILLHYWLLATHYSFFMLRVFANAFYIAAVFLTAKSAARIAGSLHIGPPCSSVLPGPLRSSTDALPDGTACPCSFCPG